LGRVDFDAQHARKVASEVSHAALNPIAAMLSDDLSDRIDEAGAIIAKKSQH
jgi:hypothetical protein